MRIVVEDTLNECKWEAIDRDDVDNLANLADARYNTIVLIEFLWGLHENA